jgi:acetyl esterase/lipase
MVLPEPSLEEVAGMKRLILALVVLLVAACSSAAPPATPMPVAPSQPAPGAVPSATPSTAAASPSGAAAPSAPPAYPATSAGPFPASIAAGLRTEVDVLYTDVEGCGGWGDCTVPLDILAPTATAGLPTVVLLHGGPVPFHERRYLDVLAAGIARRGAVVFLASYRSGATGNPVTDSIEDVTCAVRYARSVTEQYGGDPSRVVLVGHSIGGDLALSTAVNAETETPDCLAEGDGRPEAAVALAAVAQAGLQAMLGDASAPGPPIFMAGGADDVVAATMGPAALEALKAAGFEAEFQEFPATSHESIVDPAESPATLDLIFKAIEQARPD